MDEPERLKLGEELIENGWRLACQTFSMRDVSIYIPSSDELDDVCSGKQR